MSVSLIDSLAAMLQGNSAPSEQKKVDNRPVVKGSAFELIRLLNAKQYNREAVVKVDGVAIEFEDGSPITFGDLAYRVAEAVRQDGSVGPDYPVVWGLTQGEAGAAITWLKSQVDKPKASTAKRSNGRKNTATQNESSELAEALLAALRQAAQGDPEALGLLTGKPAKPVPANGHRKVARPNTIAFSDSGRPITEGDLDSPELAEGETVWYKGTLYQVTEHASGKPAFRKTIV